MLWFLCMFKFNFLIVVFSPFVGSSMCVADYVVLYRIMCVRQHHEAGQVGEDDWEVCLQLSPKDVQDMSALSVSNCIGCCV